MPATGAQHSAKCESRRWSRWGYHRRIVASKLSAKATTIFVAMAVALVAVGITYHLLAGRQQQLERMDASIERAVLAAIDEMASAAERVDADALFQYVRGNERGALVSSGRVFQTRDDALAETRRNFQRLATLKYRFGPRQVTLLSSDAALLVVEVTSEGTTHDGRTFSVPFVQTVILTRDQNGWRALHTHQSVPPGSR